MNLFKSIFGRNLVAATLAVLMPICCCVLRTAAAVVSEGPEPALPSCCASHGPADDVDSDRPADDPGGCEGCCVKAPVTVDHGLDDAFDQIAFRPELRTVHAEALHRMSAGDDPAVRRGEPPPGRDPTRSARDLRRIIVLQH